MELSCFEPFGNYYANANDSVRLPPINVFCSVCKMFFKEESVKFVDIEEDIQGQDILTFICPKCKKEKRSKRLG